MGVAGGAVGGAGCADAIEKEGPPKALKAVGEVLIAAAGASIRALHAKLSISQRNVPCNAPTRVALPCSILVALPTVTCTGFAGALGKCEARLTCCAGPRVLLAGLAVGIGAERAGSRGEEAEVAASAEGGVVRRAGLALWGALHDCQVETVSKALTEGEANR